MKCAGAIAWTGLAALLLAQPIQPIRLARAAPATEAPAGFSGATNGAVDQATHDADREQFEEVEDADDGLGPVYNANSCVACHANPITGGASQVTELRVGHNGAHHVFENPVIPIARGTRAIRGRSLVNDRAICPNGDFPDDEVQERVPDSENIRTLRMSLNLLGDGFVEAIGDQTLIDLARRQCAAKGKVCGQLVQVPVLEADGVFEVGRFGWKNQHASLLSFSADAYLNEMGITNPLTPADVTDVCDKVPDDPDPENEDDIETFASFMRASEAPARDAELAASPLAIQGSALFDDVGCAVCHVRTLTTLPALTPIHGGEFVVPEALGNKVIHPFSDFLLHDVGTGDGIAMAPGTADAESTRDKLRTPPLWGVRLRPRLMHDGASLTFLDAIQRHGGEAKDAAKGFKKLSPQQEEALFEFLRSL